MSGLTINYEKSAIIPINCDETLVNELKMSLNCQVLSLPIKYLGIPLGANPKKVDTWEPILERIKKKLSGWKSKLLSRAGRLVLIKSVLNSLPLYYLGIFKMPKKVIKKINSLQSRFFWGLKDRGRSIPLVKWDISQKPKKLGGLGVGDLVVKNAALLFKWWWKFSSEGWPLWKQVVCACNNIDMETPITIKGSGKTGGPWTAISNIGSLNQHIDRISNYGIMQKVGNGQNTRFWEDVWLGELSLREQFPRLYSMSNQKDCVIAECGIWDGSIWVWNLLWRRAFFQWEILLLSDLQVLL